MKFFLFFLPFFIWAKSPQLLLLKVYKDQNISGWVMSEKLDGIRAYWNGKNLISRGGNIIHAPAWFTKDYPPFEIDGELWTKREDFENILSIVRDKNPSIKWSEIKHYIFEVPHAKGNLFERLEKIKPYENSVIKIIPQKTIQNKQELNTFLDEIVAKGAEGVVVRDSNSSYINKRTSKALKVKFFLDPECEVVGYTKGKGKYEGIVGSLACRMKDLQIINIGSGLNDRLRALPPSIGTVITFKYYGLTKKGKPRFPIYLREKK